jgi:E3 ubiquitin-protein ligase NEDD4
MAMETTTAVAGELPSGWEERHTARPYFVDHNTRTTTWMDPRRQRNIPGNITIMQQTILQSMLDDGVPQYNSDFERKFKHFRSQPGMRSLSGECHVKVRRTHIFDDSYRVIMAQSAIDLKKRLVIEFAGEAGIDESGPSK